MTIANVVLEGYGNGTVAGTIQLVSTHGFTVEEETVLTGDIEISLGVSFTWDDSDTISWDTTSAPEPPTNSTDDLIKPVDFEIILPPFVTGASRGRKN